MKDRKKLLSNKTSSPRNVVGDLRLTQPLYKQEISSFNTAKSAGDSRQKLSGMTPLFNSNAFTLIELLVVVLIIGILSAIALPQYQKAVLKSRFTQAKLLAIAIARAQQAYYLANSSFTVNFDELDIDLPAPTQKHSSQTRTTYVYPWGNCHIEYGNTHCVIAEHNLEYSIYHPNNTAWHQFAGKTICIAKQEDILSNKICRQETGLIEPSSSEEDSNFYFFN